MEVVRKKLGVQGEDVESWKLMIKPQRNRKKTSQGPERIVHSSFLDFLVPATQLFSVPGPVPFRKRLGAVTDGVMHSAHMREVAICLLI